MTVLGKTVLGSTNKIAYSIMQGSAQAVLLGDSFDILLIRSHCAGVTSNMKVGIIEQINN